MAFGQKTKGYSMKKNARLYSIYFPFYALLVLDYRWLLLMLPINLAVTALVLFLTLKLSKADVKHTLKRALVPAFGAGLLADVCGVAFRFLPLLLELLFRGLGMTGISNFFGKYLSDMVIYNIYMGQVLPKLVWTVLSIVVSAVFLYVFNYRVTLKKTVTEAQLRRRMALVLALATAPWGFMCPFF